MVITVLSIGKTSERKNINDWPVCVEIDEEDEEIAKKIEIGEGEKIEVDEEEEEIEVEGQEKEGEPPGKRPRLEVV